MYGQLTPHAQEIVSKLVRDKIVWDLGAGEGHFCRRLLRLGARKVVAVEKAWNSGNPGIHWGRPDFGTLNIDVRPNYFKDVEVPPEGIEVAFLSWPFNIYMEGLQELLRASRTIIYLGSNVQGNACGYLEMFEHFREREIEAYLPKLDNTFIVYGDVLDEPRTELVGEEKAVFGGKIISFEDSEEGGAPMHPEEDEDD
jgi:hypothetical protein